MKLVKNCARVCRRLSLSAGAPRGIAAAYTVLTAGFTMLELALWLDRAALSLHVAAAAL